MQCLLDKSLLSLLALFITLQTYATTNYTFDELHKRIMTHPSQARKDILHYRKNAIAQRNQLTIGKAYYLLGEMYYTQAELLKSAKAYKKSLIIFRQLGDERMEARANQGIGSMYLAMENFDQAIRFQRKNLRYQLKHGGQAAKADAYFNIASTKACTHENDSAFYYYRVCEAIYQKTHDFTALSRVYLMTGYLYASTGNDDLALAYEYQALRTTRATRELLSIQGALYAIGSIYKKTERIDSARVYFRQALELADEVGNRDIENEICKNLSDVYRQQDSLKLSHHYLLRCQELKDDLLTPQKIHRINTIDFSDSKKENGVSAVWWILSLSILLLLSFAWFHFRGKPKNGPSETDLRKHDELEARISNQQKELMTQTIRLQQQGELIERTKSELTGLDLNEQSRLKVRTLLSELKSTQQSSNWSEFETHFNDVHLDFYKRLMIDYPQLTVNERRLCGFISLNLTNKEISEITRKSIRSIEVAKYRLSRKLEIPKEGSLKKKLTGYL